MLEKSEQAVCHETSSQYICVMQKAWGREEWIVNHDEYCGKKLIVNKGYRCSLHYHKIKEETFHVHSGRIFVELEVDGTLETRILLPGDSIDIPRNARHRFTGLEDSLIYEFSTHHREEDSYRIELSGSVDLETLKL